jgi:putative PIN family toxin of toxin-antitoxin system
MVRPSVVLDTNVIISSQLKTAGLESRLFDLAHERAVRLCVSQPILDEYAKVLSRAKFGFDADFAPRLLQIIHGFSRVVVPVRMVRASPNPSDNIFMECAEAAKADFLITGNKRHFPAQWLGTRVVNARKFFDQFAPPLTR